MPTGYTGMILEGASFKSFLTWCASDHTPNKREHIEKRIEEQKAKIKNSHEALAKLTVMSTAEAEQKFKAARDNVKALVTATKARAAAYKVQYEAMLEKVNQWQVGDSKYLNELKEFMRKQIEMSIEFDCDEFDAPDDTDYKTVAEQWLANTIEQVNRDIQFAIADLQRLVGELAKCDELAAALEKLDDRGAT